VSFPYAAATYRLKSNGELMSLPVRADGQRKIAAVLARGLVWQAVFLLTLWATAALYFDLPQASWRLRVSVI